MPVPSPFHSCTAPLCVSMLWKEWAGYYAVRSYENCHEQEYFAIRHGTALIDVSPLYKYEVRGRDAARFLAHIVVKDVTKLKVGQITYCCWCDDGGKVVDDGTVAKLSDTHFRMTSALPMWFWLKRYERGFEVEIEDSSASIAALAVQGPTARDLLVKVGGSELAKLKFFRLTKAKIDKLDSYVSRTGYTGDLGYEIWVKSEEAPKLLQLLIEEGKTFGAKPVGLDALDVSRVEAGFILNGVDYFSTLQCLTEARKSSPYEIGLGWCVNLEREPFVGQAALKAEHARGSTWALVGVELDWDEYERLFVKHGLPPHVSSAAWRTAVPVYSEEHTQIGQATSGTWSPMLKKNIALATVYTEYSEVGSELRIEVTVEYERKTVRATVVEMPFFNPPRKRA